MNRAKAQKVINRGAGKLASKLGQTFDWIRPITAFDPMAPNNEMGSLIAYLDSSPDLMSSGVRKFGTPIWYGGFDASQTLPGDYLRSQDDLPVTYYIAGQQDFVAPLVVECNRTVDIYRPQATVPTNRSEYYGGNTASQGKGLLIARGWACSIMQGPKGERSTLNLPLDVRAPWFVILLPTVPGIALHNTDQLQDDLGHRYLVSSVEQTQLGYRLTAAYAEA